MPTDTASPLHVDRASFETEVLKSDVPVVVDFWAPWCGPCRAIAPVLDDLAKKYAGQVKVAKVNVDDQPELAAAFRVSGIPTIAFLAGGKVVGTQVGFRGRPALESAFAELAKSRAA